MASNSNHFDAVIVGGGLSGLNSAATLLEKNSLNKALKILILESSQRLGGRISDGDNKSGIDLGPAWMWLNQQPHLKNFVRKHGLEVQKQAGGYGEYRMAGGLRNAIEALETKIKGHEGVRIELGKRVVSVTQKAGSGAAPEHLEVETADDEIYTASQVLLALPPQKVMEQITFNDVGDWLTADLQRRMRGQPIWMAPAGKLALMYKEKFWNAADVMGGMPFGMGAEQGAIMAYDGGMTADGSNQHALVSFVVSMGDAKSVTKENMAEQVIQQFHRGHGLPLDKLRNYERAEMKFWRTDKHIQTLQGQSSSFPQHPSYIQNLNFDDGKRRVWFVNSEASIANTGMLEGAIANSGKMAEVALEHLGAEQM